MCEDANLNVSHEMIGSSDADGDNFRDSPAQADAGRPSTGNSIFFGAESDEEDDDGGDEQGFPDSPASPSSDAPSNAAEISRGDSSAAVDALKQDTSAATKVSGIVSPQHLDRQASRGSQLLPAGAEPDEEHVVIESEEGLALVQALKEAQAALDVARQYVTSPALDRLSTPRTPAPASDAHTSGGSHAGRALDARSSSTSRPMQVEVEVLTLDREDAEEPEPSRPPREVSSQSPPVPVEPAPPASRAAPSRDHVNALHMRFGEQAAKARVERQQANVKVEQRQQRAEAAKQLRHAAEDAARGEELRKSAARRMASERRIREEAQQEEAESRLVELIRGKKGRQNAKNAARRARSESVRHREIEVEQLQREMASEMQREQHGRCENGDSADCRGRPWLRKNQVDTRPSKSLPPRGLCGVSPDDEGGPGTDVGAYPRRKEADCTGGSARLPRIGYPPRHHTTDAPRPVLCKPVSGAVTHLPQLVRA